MKTRQRRSFSAEMKARIALEAIKGQRTTQEIASHYGIHPNQVTGPCAGQRFRRAAVANGEVRRHLPEGLQRRRGDRRRAADILVQDCQAGSWSEE